MGIEAKHASTCIPCTFLHWSTTWPILPIVWWTGMHAPQCVHVTLHSSPFQRWPCLLLDPPIEQLDRHPPSATRCWGGPGFLPDTYVAWSPFQLQHGIDSCGDLRGSGGFVSGEMRCSSNSYALIEIRVVKYKLYESSSLSRGYLVGRHHPELSAHQLTLPSWFLRVCAMLFGCHDCDQYGWTLSTPWVSRNLANPSLKTVTRNIAPSLKRGASGCDTNWVHYIIIWTCVSTWACLLLWMNTPCHRVGGNADTMGLTTVRHNFMALTVRTTKPV